MALVVGACSANAYPPPSEAEARAHLNAVVTTVRSRDLSGLCLLGSGTCDRTLDEADPARLPDEAPVVVGTKIVQPTRRADGAVDAGGFLLQLCGVDGLGDPYYSEMLVFAPDDTRLISINTVYWLGMTIAGSDETNPGPSANPNCP